MNSLGGATPTARKAHTCSYCGGVIAKGTQYRRWVTFDMGTAITGKGHFACEKAWWACEWSRWEEELPTFSDFRNCVLGPFVEALTTTYLPRLKEWVYA